MTSFKFSLISVTVHFIILLSSIENINCQVDSLNCFAKNNTHIFEESWLIDIELNSDKIEKALYYLMMNGNEKCNLYVYAKVFDQLLNNGLDLEFDISKTPCVLYNSYFYSQTQEQKDKEQKIRDKHNENCSRQNTYIDFLRFQGLYKSFREIRIDIDSKIPELNTKIVILTMKLDHESVVEDILELKYAHLTREKLDNKWLEMIGY